MTPEALWQLLSGEGHTPSRLGCFNGSLLILGSGRCIWEDLDVVEPWSGHVMAINDIGAHFRGPIRHWVSMHPRFMNGWMTYRQNHSWGGGDKPLTHSHKATPGIDCVWTLNNWNHGTSGLFACYVGLLLGYTNILLAGVPLTQDGRYFDSPRYGGEFTDPSQAWVWARDNVFDGRVTSLSGKSKEILNNGT